MTDIDRLARAPQPRPDGGLAIRPRAVWLVALGAAARLALAAAVGLGVDESYVVAVGRRASLSYYDHPPLSFWLAHVAATAFGSEARVVVRLPFVLLFAATTWLMYRLTARLFGETAGWFAALCLNLSAVFSVSTASWVLPDGPLMFGLTACGCCLVRVLFDPTEESRAWGWWLAAGAAAGVAALSKYQTSLFLAGVLLFLVSRPAHRRWLRRPEPYAALMLTLLMFSPVLVWNAAHGWVSIAFQLGRGASPAHITIGRRAGALAQNVAGQAAWVLPWIWVPMIVVLIGALRQRPIDDRRWFCACLAVVPIALFTVVSLGGQPGLPHWPASGYLFLFPLLGDAIPRYQVSALHRRFISDRALRPPHAPLGAGAQAATRPQPGAGDSARPLVVWLAGSMVSFAVLVALATSAAISGWPARMVPSLFRRGDPTLEALDWSDLRPGLDSLGVLARPRVFVAGTSWVQSGKVAYALGPHIPVVCLSADPRGFGDLSDERALVGEDAVIVDRVPARHDALALYAPYFDHLTTAGRISVRRRGHPAFDVAVYLGQDFRRPYPTTTAVPAATRSGDGTVSRVTSAAQVGHPRADDRGR